MEPSVGEQGGFGPVRRRRLHDLLDSGQRERVPDDPAACLVVGMPHATDPRVTPRDHTIRPHVGNHGSYSARGFRRRLDRGIREVEKQRFRTEHLTGFSKQIQSIT